MLDILPDPSNASWLGFDIWRRFIIILVWSFLLLCDSVQLPWWVARILARNIVMTMITMIEFISRTCIMWICSNALYNEMRWLTWSVDIEGGHCHGFITSSVVLLLPSNAAQCRETGPLSEPREGLTICRSNDKGSTLSSFILRPWVKGPVGGYRTRNLLHESPALNQLRQPDGWVSQTGIALQVVE